MIASFLLLISVFGFCFTLMFLIIILQLIRIFDEIIRHKFYESLKLKENQNDIKDSNSFINIKKESILLKPIKNEININYLLSKLINFAYYKHDNEKDLKELIIMTYSFYHCIFNSFYLKKSSIFYNIYLWFNLIFIFINLEFLILIITFTTKENIYLMIFLPNLLFIPFMLYLKLLLFDYIAMKLIPKNNEDYDEIINYNNQIKQLIILFFIFFNIVSILFISNILNLSFKQIQIEGIVCLFSSLLYDFLIIRPVFISIVIFFQYIKNGTKENLKAKLLHYYNNLHQLDKYFFNFFDKNNEFYNKEKLNFSLKNIPISEKSTNLEIFLEKYENTISNNELKNAKYRYSAEKPKTERQKNSWIEKKIKFFSNSKKNHLKKVDLNFEKIPISFENFENNKINEEIEKTIQLETQKEFSFDNKLIFSHQNIDLENPNLKSFDDKADFTLEMSRISKITNDKDIIDSKMWQDEENKENFNSQHQENYIYRDKNSVFIEKIVEKSLKNRRKKFNRKINKII